MKVFVAKVVGWEYSEVLGVFSSEDAANERIASFFANLVSPDEVDVVGDVSEFVLDANTASFFEKD